MKDNKAMVEKLLERLRNLVGIVAGRIRLEGDQTKKDVEQLHTWARCSSLVPQPALTSKAVEG